MIIILKYVTFVYLIHINLHVISLLVKRHKSLIFTNKNCELNYLKMGEIDDFTFQTFLGAFVGFCH